MTGVVEEISEAPLWWVDCDACGVGTEVRVDPARASNQVKRWKTIERWFKPSFCPHCGKRLKRVKQ